MKLFKCYKKHVSSIDLNDSLVHYHWILDVQNKIKSSSDQPTTCPICGAILRQSRNLRRHLELLHFGVGNNNKGSIRRRGHNLRTCENNDLLSTPLSLTSTSGDQISLPGSVIPGSNTGNMTGSSANGIYSSESSASMLSCLLPNLPSLSSPHDVFRHGEMLRAGIAYHVSSRQHVRHMQRTDVT